jgi:macrodomain Ter protein organizer (MatP/YcbG family)
LGATLNFEAKGLSDNNGCFMNNGEIVKRWIERALEDPLTMNVKSDVMNELKRHYPAEVITDFAGKLCIKEVESSG